MNSWNKNRQENIYNQKLQKVKSTMHKSKNKILTSKSSTMEVIQI